MALKRNRKKNFYITTPIYYASGNPHIGHAYCTLNADVIARYNRELGLNVFFLTGTDEHGEKIQKNALAKGMQPQEYVDQMANTFKKLWTDLGVSNDYFIRTTDDQHIETVQKIFTKLLENGDIYKDSYKGWYCTPCESFFTESQLGENHTCPDCHRECHEQNEEAYFLNCKKYLPQLLKFYKEHPDFVPQGKLNEMIKTFIEPGLDDLCITRTSFNWGIPVKEDPKHVIYVWIDALINYISALGYLSKDNKNFKTFFGDNSTIFQLAGREINRFHTIYWPILLMALGIRLPDTVFIHGLLVTKSGTKMSKSLGNAPSPYPLIERFGLDSLRYYITREIQLGDDGNFTAKMFVDRINNDLVNNYGNLVNRTINMIKKYFDFNLGKYVKPTMPESVSLIENIDKTFNNYMDYFDSYQPSKSLNEVMNLLDEANKYIEKSTPWNLAKGNETEKLYEVLQTLVEVIRCGSIMLKPVLINKANEALDELNIPENLRTFESILKHNKITNIVVNSPVALFPRLDNEKGIAFLEQLIEPKQ